MAERPTGSPRFYKISFCTVAMNRLEHLRKTIAANMRFNRSYPECEFIILDYSSRPNQQLLPLEVKQLVDIGPAVLYQVRGQRYFNGSHARNIAFLSSSGQVVVNIDADNLTGEDYAFRVNEIMHCASRPFIVPRKGAPHDTKGRVGCFRSHFLDVGGYDESMSGWGWEDINLRKRLRIAEGKPFDIDPLMGSFIRHGSRMRTCNMESTAGKMSTSAANRMRSNENIAEHGAVANVGRRWGVATLHKSDGGTKSTGWPPRF